MAKKVPATLLWSEEGRQYIWQKEGNTEKKVGLSNGHCSSCLNCGHRV